jgi:tetratricopeptide (TPR) repeat protein
MMVSVPLASAQDSEARYNQLSEDASQATQRGELTRAIELYEKALPVAPEVSRSFVHNNLAALLLRRGNYAISKNRDLKGGLEDYLKAYYYIGLGWPEGLERRPIHDNNLRLSKENILVGYQNLGIKPADKMRHLQMAKDFRAQGKFQIALVEYERVSQLDSANLEAYQGLGDLFNVLNQPDKSKKYYLRATQIAGGKTTDDIWMRLGVVQNKSGQINEAIASLNRALAINPNNAAALNTLKDIWRKELSFLVALPPEELARPERAQELITAHANYGVVLQKIKSDPIAQDLAEKEYQQADALALRYPSVPFETKKLIRLNRGSLYQEKKNFQKAQECYQSVLAVVPTDFQANYYMATLQRDMGKPDAALQAFFKALALKPDDETIHRDIITLIKQQPTPQGVDMYLKTYADKQPMNPAVQAKVGEMFHERQNLPMAIQYYKRAIALNPRDGASYANLGSALRASGNSLESMQALERAAALDPDNATVKGLLQESKVSLTYGLYQDANNQLQAGKVGQAIETYRQAVANDPNNADGRAAFGVALQQAERFQEAAEQYQRAIAIDPNNGQYYYYLATVYHQQQNLPAAKSNYEKALRLKPDLTEARQSLDALRQNASAELLTQALNAYNAKQYAVARQRVDAVLKDDPGNATAYYYRGLVATAEKTRPLAIQSYQEATRLDPKFTDAYYALAIELDGANRRPEAKSAYQKYIQLMEGSGQPPADAAQYLDYARQRVSAL